MKFPDSNGELKAITDLTDDEVSKALTFLNKKEKDIKKQTKYLKDYIKESVSFEEDEREKYFGEWRLTWQNRTSLDKEALKENSKHFDVYNKIISLYSKRIGFIKFG